MPKKPTLRKRKPVAEGDYEVIVKDTSPGAKVKATASDVDAISPDAAMKAAVPQGTAHGSEEVVVRKKDPRADKSNPSNHGVLGEAALAAISYPYRLGLPATFRSMIETIDLPHRIVGDGIVIKFTTPEALTEGMKRLLGSTDRRAALVLDGIKRSI